MSNDLPIPGGNQNNHTNPKLENIFESGEVDIHEKENILLAYCCQDKAFMSDVMMSGVTKEWFVHDATQHYFEIFSLYYARHKVACPRSHIEYRLRSGGCDAQNLSAGLQYFDQLKNFETSEEEFPHILSEFVEIYKRRLLVKAQRKLKEDIESGVSLDDAIRTLHAKTTFNNIGRKNMRFQLKDFCLDTRSVVWESVHEAFQNPNKNAGWDLGLDAIDEYFVFKPERLHLVVGMTSQGKTTFARCCAMRLTKNHGLKTLIVSCEESAQDYFLKMASGVLNIPLYKLERGTLSEDELIDLDIWSSNTNAAIAPNGGWIKVLEVPAKEYSLVQIENIMLEQLGDDLPDVIIVDQLNLLAPIWNRGDKTHLEHGDSSTYLRDMCKKYKMCGILLAQVNRSAIKSTREKTRIVEINIENIEGSNRPGQDADVALAVSSPKEEEGFMIVKNLKNRAGRNGWEVRLAFNKEIGMVENAPALAMYQPDSTASSAPATEYITLTNPTTGESLPVVPGTGTIYDGLSMLDNEESLPEAQIPQDEDEDGQP